MGLDSKAGVSSQSMRLVIQKWLLGDRVGRASKLVYCRPCVCFGAIMSETRRGLFKTSIMSALGLTAVGGLAGCQSDGGWQGPFASNPDPGIPIVGIDNNKKWYIFKYDSSSQKYTAYWTPPPPSLSLTGIDTPSFYQSRKTANELYLTGETKINFGGIPTLYIVNTDSSSIVTNPSELNNAYMQSTSWNEIGKS